MVVALLAVVLGDLAAGFLVGWAMYMLVLRRGRLQTMAVRWPRLVGRLAPQPAPAEQR